jgi:hypothetical protein
MPGKVPEPNRMTRGQELCVAANLSQAYSGAWGWSDEPCALRLPSICELREWHCAGAGAGMRWR